MAQAVRCIDGPLAGQVCFMQGAPSVLYVRRTVGVGGVVYAPDPHEVPELLRAGLYRKSFTANASAQFTYRFEH